MNLGHWSSAPPLSGDDMPYGFVYLITNKLNGRKYIGKKQVLTVRKRPPLKGRRNRRLSVVETDWREYTSSSNEVNGDIKAFGKDNFIFEILRWCSNKAELGYFEAKEQFDRDVLLREDYYNGIVNLRLSRFTPGKKLINIKNEYK